MALVLAAMTTVVLGALPVTAILAAMPTAIEYAVML
jgi:hypothetical protein